ncbi:DUF397 domain-containing protein [Streptomyces sp. NPDC001137]|uniref:DUF397 domain-containing protein n=1 Tax=Streptomyces sp. NPDC001137 TaxID=3154378 RepID=UPI00331B5B45
MAVHLENGETEWHDILSFGDRAAALQKRAEATEGHIGTLFGTAVRPFTITTTASPSRHSNVPDGPALLYARSETAAMIEGVKVAEFDHLAEG